jgi:hypothetical protein
VYVWKIQAVFLDGKAWSNEEIGEHKNLNNNEYGTILLVR